MYEACSALLKIAFKERGMKRVFATCTKENIASRSLIKKLGMKYEGCLRANSYRKGRFWDLEYYSILDDEFKSFSKADKSLRIVFETDPNYTDLNILLDGICSH